MVNHQCYICGIDSIFFAWSSDRRFNRKKLVDMCKNIDMNKRSQIISDSYPVCLYCIEKYGLMNE